MIGTVVGDSSWIAQIDANSLNADTSQEISNELIKELRKESPTSLLKGKVINQLPKEGTKITVLEDVITTGGSATVSYTHLTLPTSDLV